MAHRTKVHAQLTRMIGLGIACALITCAWWINTSTFQTLNFASQSLSSLLFFVIGIIYSGAVMHSQSAVRWAGAFAACLLVIVGFVLDALYHARTTDVAIAFAVTFAVAAAAFAAIFAVWAAALAARAEACAVFCAAFAVT